MNTTDDEELKDANMEDPPTAWQTVPVGGMAYVRCPSDLREALAELQHNIWSHWMQYQWSKGVVNPDGSFTIPADLVTRWQRQHKTPYDVLCEQERDSDREQADKTLCLLRRPALLPALQSLVLALQKVHEPWSLQKELYRLRLDSDVPIALNETRTHWRVTAVRDDTFEARHWDDGSAERFDRAQVSEHDQQFLIVGAEFWCVTAIEVQRITSSPRGECRHNAQRLIFVPPQQDPS